MLRHVGHARARHSDVALLEAGYVAERAPHGLVVARVLGGFVCNARGIRLLDDERTNQSPPLAKTLCDAPVGVCPGSDALPQETERVPQHRALNAVQDAAANLLLNDYRRPPEGGNEVAHTSNSSAFVFSAPINSTSGIT